MDTAKLREIAAQAGTPSYVFDLDEFNKRAELVRSCFGEKIGMCFSIKANPFLLKYLPGTFDKIEVCSPGELTICEKLGIDMSRVIFSGVNKTREDVERAADDKVGTFTVESILHLNLINDAAIKRNTVFPVLLRVTDSRGASQFGMDESSVLSIINDRERFEGVEIVGLHYFTGTGKKKAKPIEREVDYLLNLLGKIRDEQGFDIRRVEYGTGLAVDYFSENPDELEEERLRSVMPKLRELGECCELTVEMGRFFAAPCGYYLTRVADGEGFAIVDGGLHQLKYDGQLQGMQIPKIIHLKNSDNTGEERSWTICGSLCTTADVLARGCEFEGFSIGDDLVFCRTGAYSCMEGMSIFLSRDMPSIAVYSEKDGPVILRRPILTDSFNTP